MKSKLIILLTYNDQTVRNAMDVFKECYDLPIDNWGFKNNGISKREMCELNDLLKSKGKTTFFEVVTYDEESCMNAAKFAHECGFDYLIGTLYYPRVWEFIKTKSLRYFPFVGDVKGIPSVLRGKAEDIVLQAEDLFYNQNVHGVNILAYRYQTGSSEKLAKSIVDKTKSNTIIAGGIDSFERIKEIDSIQPWGFTIGSALFAEKFVPGAGYRTNLEKVIDFMDLL